MKAFYIVNMKYLNVSKNVCSIRHEKEAYLIAQKSIIKGTNFYFTKLEPHKDRKICLKK